MKRLTPAPGTAFYNRACFYELDCFGLTTNIDPENATARFDGGSLIADDPDAHVADVYGADNAPSSIYYLSGSHLVSDSFGTILRQNNDPVNNDARLFFPSDSAPRTADASEVVCSRDDSVTPNTIYCSSQQGGTLYVCYGNMGVVLATADNPDSDNCGQTILSVSDS